MLQRGLPIVVQEWFLCARTSTCASKGANGLRFDTFTNEYAWKNLKHATPLLCCAANEKPAARFTAMAVGLDGH